MNTTASLDLGEYPRALAWIDQGRRLAIGLADGSVALLDPMARLLRRFTAHQHGLQALAAQPGSQSFVTTGEDGRARIWNSDAHEPVADLEGGAAWIEHAAWSTDGSILATAGGRQLRFWSADFQLLSIHKDFPSTLAAIGWSGSENLLGAACYGGVSVVEPGNEALAQTLAWRSSLISMAWSRDSRHLAAGTQENSISYWPLPSDGEPPLQMSGYAGKVRQLAWDRKSRLLASGGGEDITIWDVGGKGPAGTSPLQLRGHDAGLTALQWQENGDILASGDRAGAVWLWNPRGGDRGILASRIGTPIVGLAWSPDDHRLVITSDDGVVRILA